MIAASALSICPRIRRHPSHDLERELLDGLRQAVSTTGDRDDVYRLVAAAPIDAHADIDAIAELADGAEYEAAGAGAFRKASSFVNVGSARPL